MDHIDHYYKLTLPLRAWHRVDHNVLASVMKAAGGASVTRSTGQWFDDDGVLHEDVNEVFQWNYNVASHEEVRSALIGLIINVLSSTGEKAVMVEHMDGSGYCCKIVYPGTPPYLIP